MTDQHTTPVGPTIDDAARKAIEARLGMAPDQIQADGRTHRFATRPDKQQDGAGWYIAEVVGSGVVIRFGDFRTMGNTTETWRSWEHIANATPPSAEQRDAYNAQLAKAQTDKAARAEQAAARAADYWRDAKPADPNHPYLQKKGLDDAYGLRQMPNGNLLMPMRSVDGQITTSESISGEGEKRFLAGGVKKGSFYTIGELEEGKPAYVAEGFATAASVHKATGAPVIVAGDAGNIPPVVDAVLAQRPNLHLIHAADAGEPGGVVERVTDELKAKHGIESRAAPGEKKDWNDIHTEQGLSEVRERLARAGDDIHAARKGASAQDRADVLSAETMAAPAIVANAEPPYHAEDHYRALLQAVRRQNPHRDPEHSLNHAQAIANGLDIAAQRTDPMAPSEARALRGFLKQRIEALPENDVKQELSTVLKRDQHIAERAPPRGAEARHAEPLSDDATRATTTYVNAVAREEHERTARTLAAREPGNAFDPHKHYQSLYALEHAAGVKTSLSSEPEDITRRTMHRVRDEALALEQQGRTEAATLLLQVARQKATAELSDIDEAGVTARGLQQLRDSIKERAARADAVRSPQTTSPPAPRAETANVEVEAARRVLRDARDFVTDQFADGRAGYVDHVMRSMKEQGRAKTIDAYPETETFYQSMLPAAREHAKTLPEDQRTEFLREVTRETLDRLAEGRGYLPPPERESAREKQAEAAA